MSNEYTEEKTKIKIKNIEYDVDCGTGDAEGCLRNKVRIAALEQRIANLEKLLGVKP